MADQEIIKHTKAAYKVWKDPHTGWKHKLKEIGLEIFIIVFAVSLSIWLHNLSEKNHDRHEATEFLEGLKTDLQKDTAEMRDDLRAYTRVVQGTAYFQKARNSGKLHPDSTAKYQRIFYNTTYFNSNSSRFEGLKASGRLTIIENRKLLNDILDLYQEQIPYINMLNNNYNTYKADRLGAFLDEHVRYDSIGNISNWSEIMPMPQLQNALHRAEGVSEVVAQYNKTIVLATSILNEIEEALK